MVLYFCALSAANPSRATTATKSSWVVTTISRTNIECILGAFSLKFETEAPVGIASRLQNLLTLKRAFVMVVNIIKL